MFFFSWDSGVWAYMCMQDDTPCLASPAVLQPVGDSHHPAPLPRPHLHSRPNPEVDLIRQLLGSSSRLVSA